jgi:hypothetical protein
MYLSPRSAASTRASGVRRAPVGAVSALPAPRLPRRVGSAGWSWTSDGSGMIPGAGEVWDSMANVVFISATFRAPSYKIRRSALRVALPSLGARLSVRVAVRRAAGVLCAKSLRRSGEMAYSKCTRVRRWLWALSSCSRRSSGRGHHAPAEGSTHTKSAMYWAAAATITSAWKIS